MNMQQDFDSEDSSTDEQTWISWFCGLRHHEFFCEIDHQYIQDRFNLYGLKEEVGPLYEEAKAMILGWAPTEEFLADASGRTQKILDAALQLYGLTHARYIITTQGLAAMKCKFTDNHFGSCHCYFCDNNPLVPLGLSDHFSPTYENPVKTYCPMCGMVFNWKNDQDHYIDGAFFGTTFAHLFFMTYTDLKPSPNQYMYIPRVFGFKVQQPENSKGEPLEWKNNQSIMSSSETSD